MPLLARAACIAVVASGLLTWSSFAHADDCAVRFVPKSGGTVPANAPVLLAYVTADGSDGGVAPALGVSAVVGPTTTSPVILETYSSGPLYLRFPNGTVLEEGASTIAYSLDCGDAGDAGSSWPLVVGPAAPFPKTLGTASASHVGVGQAVTITPDPTVAAWAGLVRVGAGNGGLTSFDAIDGSPFTMTADERGTTIAGQRFASSCLARLGRRPRSGPTS